MRMDYHRVSRHKTQTSSLPITSTTFGVREDSSTNYQYGSDALFGILHYMPEYKVTFNMGKRSKPLMEICKVLPVHTLLVVI